MRDVWITIHHCEKGCGALWHREVSPDTPGAVKVDSEDVGLLWACADYRETESSILRRYAKRSGQTLYEKR